MTIATAQIVENIEKAVNIWTLENAPDGIVTLVDNYFRGKHRSVYMPSASTNEYKELARKSMTNWMPLVVKTQSQSLGVNGYRRGNGDDSVVWDIWQKNKMDCKQNAITDAAIKFGLSYGFVSKKNPALKTPKNIVIKGYSPRQMVALYEDPAWDSYPVFAVRVIDKNTGLVDYFDEIFVTRYERRTSETNGVEIEWAQVSSKKHGMTIEGAPICPIVRFSPDMDLDGRHTGSVFPVIEIQDSINQAVFDLLIAETFGSFKIRTATGMEPPLKLDADGKPIWDENAGQFVLEKIVMGPDRIMWTPEIAAKFGSLDETDLMPIIAVVEARIKHLAALSQTPPHYLLGQLINLSAEALAAAENSLMRLTGTNQLALGESFEQLLQLCAEGSGLTLEEDAEIVWADKSSKSIGAIADSISKYSAAGIPLEGLLWEIPWMTDQKHKQLLVLISKQDAIQASAAKIQAAANRVNTSKQVASGDKLAVG